MDLLCDPEEVKIKRCEFIKGILHKIEPENWGEGGVSEDQNYTCHKRPHNCISLGGGNRLLGHQGWEEIGGL